MIIVRGASRRQTAESIKEWAEGEIDEYGNPFHIIKLRWTGGMNHRMTDYAKTRGFEDAIIKFVNGEMKITYRKQGSAQWLRPVAGGRVGVFIAEVPQTPINMGILASGYRDGLYRIMKDPAVENEVKALSEKRWSSMTDEAKEFNENRLKSMHTRQHEVGMAGFEASSPSVQTDIVKEDKKDIEIRQNALAKKEAELAKRERALLKKESSLIDKGAKETIYNKEYLSGLKFPEVKRLARNLGAKLPPTAKTIDYIEAILEVQIGNMPEEESVAD